MRISNRGDNDNQDESLVRVGVGQYTSMAVNNISLSNDAANKNAIRLAYLGNGGKITFSGTNTFNITNELTRAVTSINFANGASVKVQRTANDYKNSIFYMGVIASSNYAGYGNNITMGDGSSFSASLYDLTQSPNYSTIYQYLNGMTVGDNVTWSQNGFQRFIYMPDNSGVQNAVFTFGQNFDLIIPKTTQPYSIYLVNNTKMIFNAGAQVDINQYYPDVVVDLSGSSSIQFISPKKLHLAMLNTNGTPANNGYGVIYNFGSASPAFTINNSSLSSWTGYDTSQKNPNGDFNGQFSQLIIKNSANAYLVNSDGSTTSTNILSNQSREIQTNSIAPGNIYVQYVDSNGNNIGSPKQITLPDGAYIGQFINLKSKEVAQTDMPANYMWALGNQVYSGAKKDAQSGGDSSTPNDNGDSDTGQANVAIVPVLGTNFTYKVYVYGQPETTSYEYVDKNTGKIMPAQNAGTAAPVSSNYGNVIDWTNSYYTKDGVPAGYHISTTAAQPTTTTVGTSNPTVQLYVEGNSQTVTPTYQTDGGQILSPVSPITISGITGQTVTIPTEPAVDNYEISYVLVNGQQVAPGATLTLANGTDKVVYVYKSLDGSRSTAEAAINGAADAAIKQINALPNMSDADKATAVNKVKADQSAALSTIQTAKSKDVVVAAQNSGVLNIQRDAAAAVIDSDANAQVTQVQGMTNMSSDDQAAFLKQIETHRNNAKTDLSNATSAADLQTKTNAANVTLTQDGSQAELDDYGQSALKQINQMPGLSTDQLAQAAKDINRAVANGQNNIGTKSLIDDVLAALKAGENDVDNVKNGYKGQSDTAMSTAKTNAITALGQFETDAKAKIAALSPLSDDAKSAADKVIDQQVATATTNINNSTNTEQVAEAQINGQVTVSQTVANSTLDNDALIATNKINALSNIDVTAKTAAITNVQNAQAAAKQAVAAATNTNDITTAQAAGQTKEAQIASDAVLDDAALQQTNIIGALKNLGANQQKAIDQVNADRDSAKAKVAATTTPAMAQSEEQNGVLVIARDGDQTVLADYAQAAQNRIAALPDLKDDQISQATTGITNALQTGQGNITAAQQVADATAALQKAEGIIDSITATAQTNSDTTVNNAKNDADDAIDKAVADAQAVVQGLSPLSDQATRLAAIKNDGDAAKAKIAADKNTADISSDQTAGLQAITNDKNAAILQSAKEGAIAAITKVNQDVKTAIGNMKPLDPKEITAYQDQADNALATAKTQIDQETTVSAVNGDQTSFTSQINGIQDAATLQNTKEDDNNQLDQYAQNAKNAIADKTGMPDLSDDQISGYDNQIVAAVSSGKSSINGGQDTTTVASNFQAAKNSIDKIKANAQAESDAIVAQAKSDADTAIDQAVANAQAAVQKLNPLKDQAVRLATIKSDGDAAKAKIAADKNKADIATDQAAGLQKISADQDAATLESAKEAAIAAVTQAATTTKTTIGGLQPLQSGEIKNFQDQVDAAVTAATNQINQETTTDAVASDQANAINNTIADIQTAASLQSVKEKDNAQLLQDGQTAKNKIAAMPDLTKDQIAQANSDIDLAVSNGQTAINSSQNETDVNTNFQTAESNINKVTATAQSQSDNAVANAKTAAGDALDKAAAAAKVAIDQLSVLKADEKATFKNQVDSAVTAAKNSIQNEKTVAAVTADQNNGLTAISNQQVAATLQNAKEDSINQLNAYAQNGRTALTKLPNLTDTQAGQANDSITNAVNSGTTNINAATDLAGVTRALVAAEFAVNRAGVIAINQSNAALVSARTAAEAAINAVASAVKTTINNLSPLSDRQTRLSQVDTDIANAQTALENTSATADVTAAQGKAIAALNADAANAQQKSSQEDAISRLQNYATNAETALAGMSGLSADNLTTAKTAIESAVTNGDTNIQGASEHAAMASALIAAEQAIDAATTTAQNQSQQVLAQAQSDASAAIDAALAAAKTKLSNLSLSTDDQAAQEKQLEADAGNAKTSINAATSLAAVTQAQQTGAQAINQDILSAEIASLQTEAKKRLQAYADQTKKTISTLPDLPGDSYTNAYSGIDALVTVWAGNITNTKNLADMQNALYSGASAINLVSLSAQANSQKIVDQERAAAEAAINQAATTARQTINSLSPLSDKSTRLDQIDQDVKDADAALDAATNNQGFTAAQSAGTTAITNHVTAAQLKSAQEQADADLATYGQNVYAKIAALPDLTNDQRQKASTDITNAVSQGKTSIDATTSQANVAPALAAAEKIIDGIQETAENNNQAAVTQAQSDADNAIDAAAKAAKTTIDALTPLSDKVAREAQIDTDAKNAKDAISKATTKADVTAAQNAGTATITNDTTAAQLQSAKEKADADLDTYGQSAKDAIKAMPDLSDDQRKQANDAIDAAVKQAKDTINSLNPLSDRAKRLAQVDTDADSAKKAIAQANNKTDITTAQNAGTATIAQDATDAQLKSTKEAKDATFAAYGQTAKDAIVKMPDLTQAQIDQANKDIDAAVSAGQGQIDVAPDADSAETALINGEKSVDAVQAGAQTDSNTTVQQERDAANAVIDAAVKNANAAIEGMNPLADKTTPEGKVAAAAQAAKDAIAKAGNKTAITAAQNSGTAAITNETTAAQLQSKKEAAKATLAKYGQDAESAIAVMPDLTKDQIAQANSEIDAAVKAGQTNIDSATDSDGVATALKNGEAAVDAVKATAQTTSATTVANEQKTASDAIDAAAAKAKAAIDALNPLSDKADREAQVDKDAAAAKAAINNATNQADITKAQNAGTDTLNTDTANAQLKSTKEAADATLAQHGADAKAAIAKMPDLTKDQIDQANTQIDAAVKAGQANIDGAADAAGVATALQNGEAAVDAVTATAKTNSATTVANEKKTASDAIDAAAAKAKAAIDAMNPLSDKATREAQIDTDAAAAKTAINNATNQTDITKAQNAGTDTLNTDTANAQLKSTKEAADATLAQHGQDAKDAIAKMPDLTPDQIKQADSDIDAAVKAGQANIDGATDANGVATALQNGEAAVDAVKASAQTNSDTTVANEKAAADKVIDDAVAAAKATINALDPLSDKTDRLNQIDTDAQNAKAAIEKATNQADITTAQNAGTTAITTDTTAAQLKSAQEQADADLAQYGQDAKNKIVAMPDLTKDQIDQANAEIDAAVKAGQGQINAAKDSTGVANALRDGKAAVDAVQATAQKNSDTTVTNEKAAANSVIDDAAAKAKAAIDAMDPLSDKTDREAQVEKDAAAAKAAINNATNQADITKAQKAGQGQIDVATDANGVATALQKGKDAVDAVQEKAQGNSTTTVNDEKSAADSIIDAAATAAKATINALNPLSDKANRLNQIDTDAAAAKAAIAKATNKTDIATAQNAGTATLTTDTTAAQLKSAQEKADADLAQYGQSAKDKIAVMPDLTKDQINQANDEIDAAVKAGQGQIDAVKDTDGVAKALADGKAAVDAVQTTSQTNSDTTVAKEKAAANSVIDDAAAKAKAAIDGMNPLSDKADREAQVDKDAAAAKAAINSATNAADIDTAQKTGTDTLNTDTANAQLKSTKEAADATLAQHGADAKAAIAVMPDLTKDQIDQANSQIDAAVKAGQGQIDSAADAAGVATALKNGEDAVDAVKATAQTNSDTTVANEKTAANKVIDDAAAKAKAAIDGMNPLSDKAAREAQIDTDAAAAKAAINSATNQADITKAQNAGTDALNTDTANAQLKSTKEAADAELTKYGQSAKDKIAVMPDLTKDQINQANAEIAAAVKAGQANIDGAADADGVAKALADGKANVDKVQETAQTNSDTTVTKEKNDANSVIDDAAAKAKAAIDALNPLSDKADREAQVEKDAATAKAAINNATNQADITKAQNAGTDALNTDTANAQLKSTKEAADADLAKYGQAAKDKITAMPDLTPDQIKQANADIDAAVKAGQANIDGSTDADGVAKALADGKANVDKVQETAQTNSDTTVKNEKAAANSVIDDAAAKAKAAIDGLTPLSDKATREAQIDTDAAAAKAAIAKATDKADIDTAQKAGTDTLDTDTANAQLKSTKEAADADLAKYGQAAKDKISAMPDLTPDQIKQANADIDAAVKAGQTNIDSATDANGVAKALKNGESAVDAVKATAQTNSDTTVEKEKAAANSVIDDAAAKAKAAIDGLTPLSDKAAREAQIDTDAQNAKAAIAKATNKADINTAQKAGTDTLNTDTANAQLKSQKEAADAELTKYGQAAKDKIVAIPDLTPDQINQANAQIDAAVKNGQSKIDAAIDANGVSTALKNGESAVDAVKATAQTNSDTTVAKEKATANSVIDDAAAKAKAAIDGLTPLSDKAARETQIDTDAAAAKAAIAKATNAADIDKAQKAGTDTLNTDTAAAQLKSQKEAADAELTKYGQDAKAAIAKLPDLTPDQINQANAQIDAAVKAGQGQIDAATDANGVATALKNGEAAVDAVKATAQTNSETTVEKEKAAANRIIDDAAAKAKAAIDGLTPLSDKAAREAQIDTDAQNAKAAIAKATNAADISHSQKAGTDALNTDADAAQLKSRKEAADADLAKYGQSTKTTIQKLPDLTPDQVTKANGNIDAAVKNGQNQIDAATDTNGVTTGLNNGKAAIDKIAADAASASGQAVAKAKTQAKTAIDNAGGQAKATIDGLTALVDAQKGADKAKVDQDAAIAKAKIDQATTTQAIKQALDDGLATIQKDVENSILDNTKGEADSQLAGYAQAAKDKIAHLPNLTPEEIAQADREIDEIVAQGKKAIAQAAAENEVKVAVKTNKEKIDGVMANAQAESDRQKPVAKVAEPAPTPQPQPAPKQTPVLPMTSRLQKHHTDTTLLPLVALGLLTLFSGKRRRQHDDKE
ncbi:DUF1542 domain-containing protein [Fructobacillus tropaeoli]|uniref:DUF1542 domain-containing protein n=1 Tax=Fructobacillus tropaeoli TaxID=709323 RepID=UPI001945442E|nr:DUF1542 domain-containing protein [Fructobacillus tropaeoli]GIC69913.1 hypothetical protein FT12353_05510 [Fructobacillus tropaeoli]